MDGGRGLAVTEAAGRLGPALLASVGSRATGLTTAEVAERQARFGPNAVTSHRARLLPVLWHQVRSPLLGLLLVAAAVSYVLGERSDAVIIGVILTLSVGLGLANEYRAERAAEALHGQISHRTVVVRDGQVSEVDSRMLVPGDIVKLKLGDIVPADLRLLGSVDLACDESVLTGESMPADKQAATPCEGAGLADLSNCALMGTVVHGGTGDGVVVATGASTAFGRIASGLSSRPTETAFQVGLRRFSMLLVWVAAALTSAIFIVNVVLQKPLLDALLFSLAIAVGITPQLLPAVVSTSLAAGSRQLARQRVLVKRLVCIEDLGDVDTLFTDKTGTLTQGRISFMRAVPAGSADRDDVLRLGLLCTEGDAPSVGNPLDVALRDSPLARAKGVQDDPAARIAVLPFDHERRLSSVLVSEPGDRTTLITKGAPEAILSRCVEVDPEDQARLDAEFAAGNRVVAVASRPAPGQARIVPADEQRLRLAGFLVFLDPPRPDAAAALRRLADLGITVKVVTGDNPAVAVKVGEELGLADVSSLTGTAIDALDDDALTAAIATTTVFARVSPEQKARLVRLERGAGRAVAVLGDGVNDALALHAADVGISVDSATDVAKDAADVILLDKDLHVLADGITGGRRVFANTIKYVLMGTSSNFGNMFSAAGASLFLPFLPMLPSQILLNNLLYDTSQLAIPTDQVDPEQVRRPTHWDLRFIRRFMLVFGPLSSVFDFLTFALMLTVFHTDQQQFRTGWFVESLATQTLIIFVIRTRRIPFIRSQPSLALTLAALGVVLVGVLLPMTPLAPTLGFQALPAGFLLALVGLIVIYLVLVECGKALFYRLAPPYPAPPAVTTGQRHLRRRAHQFSH